MCIESPPGRDRGVGVASCAFGSSGQVLPYTRPESFFTAHRRDRICSIRLLRSIERVVVFCSLVAFRGEDITEEEIKKLEPILHEDGFTVDNMKSKSAAAANLCSWVISIYTYNRIYVKVWCRRFTQLTRLQAK